MTKWIGFRNTFRFGVITFGVMAFMLPFSNQITGPIPPSNSSLLDDVGSGLSPSSDESPGFCNYSSIINSSFDSSVNTNSVARVPFVTWFVLISITTIAIIGRYVHVYIVHVIIGHCGEPKHCVYCINC